MKRWLLISTAIAALAATVAFTLVGVTIDLSRWRDNLAEHASAALGRPLRLDGALTLTLRRAATLHADSVRILNPPGFATPEFVALDMVRVRFDLLDAMRSRLHVHSVEAAGGRLDLERAADGRVNWAWPPVDDARERRPFGIGEVVLRDLAVQYQDSHTARRLRFAVDELAGGIELDDAASIALRGHMADESSFALKVVGGPVRLLQEAKAQWPFTLDFDFPGTRLAARGTVDADKREARFDFDAVADDLSQLARLFDARLQHIGGAVLRGKVFAAPDAIEVAELQGRVGKSDLTGHLAVALANARPRVRGALALATLDLEPLLRSDGAQAEGGFEKLSLRDLVPVDLDVDISVRELHALPVELRDATVEVHADAERVRAPIRATVAGVPFSGRFDLDTAASVPKLAVELDASDAAVAQFVDALPGAKSIDGTLGRFALRLAGRGETLAALARDLEIALTVEAARLRYGAAGGRPIPFTLDVLDLSLSPGERLRGSARGSLEGKRTTLSFRGGTLPDMLHARVMPLTAEVATARARLRLDGTIAHANAARGSDVAFQLDAPRIGELAPWIGVAPEAKLPLGARGRVRTTVDAWRLEGTTVKLGRSAATIDIERSAGGTSPFTSVAVRGALIDVPQLATLGTGGGAVLPRRIDPSEADIHFEAARVAFKRIDLLDVKLAARVRDGRLAPSPITARVAGTPLEGTVALDPSGELPEATLDLSANAVDVGALLRALKVAEPVNGRVDALQVAVRAQGSTLRELAQRSSFTARATGGTLAVRGAQDKPVAQIAVQQALVEAPAGGRLRADVEGTLDDTPLKVEVVSGTLADLLGDAERAPFTLNARGAETHLALAGTVLLPLGRGGELELEMGGARLDTLNSLARVELPPWGPWSLRGPIEMTADGYAVRKLALRVGDNYLAGSVRLDVTGRRPRLDVRMKAPSIQLDDFPLPERLADEGPAAFSAREFGAATRELARKSERLLSVGFLRRLDAHIDVEVQQVLSGADHLADGALRIRIAEGRLNIGPAVVNIPGGKVQVALEFETSGSEVAVKASAKVERFDYGILARRLNRSDNASGLVSADIEIAGRAPSLYQIMRHADGRMDVAIWPENLGGRIFNLWSVNLLLSLLPLIDPGGEQHVNCMIGRFDMENGIISDDKLLIDTTRVRVSGTGTANFQTDQLDFVFRPRAKGLALFRLQTPLRVVGTLTDYRVGIDRRDLIFSTLRMIASPVLVPWERLTLGPLPVDGADVCTDPLRE